MDQKIVQVNSLVVQGTWVLSLVRELHPTCPNKDLAQPDKYIKINIFLNCLIFVAILSTVLCSSQNADPAFCIILLELYVSTSVSGAIVNYMDFLFLNSNCSLLVYRKKLLSFYPVTLINSLNSFRVSW